MKFRPLRAGTCIEARDRKFNAILCYKTSRVVKVLCDFIIDSVTPTITTNEVARWIFLQSEAPFGQCGELGNKTRHFRLLYNTIHINMPIQIFVNVAGKYLYVSNAPLWRFRGTWWKSAMKSIRVTHDLPFTPRVASISSYGGAAWI